MKVIAIAGWSFPPNCFDSLIHDGHLTWKVFDWQKILEDSSPIEKEIASSPPLSCLLLGWSLGGFLLYPYLDWEQVRGGLFLGIGPSFARSMANPYGVEKQDIDNMIISIKRNPNLVIKQFARRCQLNPKSALCESIKTLQSIESLQLIKSLLNGLDYLKKVQLKPITTSKKYYLLHGKKDKILNWRSSLMLAHYQGAVCQLIDHGHALLEEGKRIHALFHALIYEK